LPIAQNLGYKKKMPSSGEEVIEDIAVEDEQDEVNKGGRPWHRVTKESRRVVLEAIGLGLQQTNVARLLGISDRTLRKHYRHEIDTGIDQVNLDVARALYTRASSGKDTIASIFMLKARAGWKDTASQDAALPQKIEVTFALPESVTEEKKEMIDITPEGDGGR
jgi:hypothetical protein